MRLNAITMWSLQCHYRACDCVNRFLRSDNLRWNKVKVMMRVRVFLVFVFMQIMQLLCKQ